MAKARETAHDPPPPPVESEEESSDKEEEASSEEDGSESESEGTQTKAAASNANSKKPPSSTPAPASKKPEPQPAAKAQTTAATTGAAAAAAAVDSSSEEDEDSGSETDTESPPKKPDPSIKPIASKPMDEPEKSTATAAATKRPRSKPSASGPASPAAGAKRPPPSTPAVADSDAKEPKRSKRKLAAAENSEKKAATVDEGKKLFVRVWSEDDEIAILMGIIDYSTKKKTDPFVDLNAFHEFIKNKIDFDGTSKQLQDKIRRLKKKYLNNASKEKNGKERTFSNPHEQKAYDLSKKIWGSEKNGGEEAGTSAGETPKANGMMVRKSRSKGTVAMTPKLEKAGEAAMEDKSLGSEKHKTVSFAPDGRSVEEWILKDGMVFMKEDDRVEMEKKWKEHRTEETGLLIKKLELMLAEAKKVYKGLNSSGD